MEQHFTYAQDAPTENIAQGDVLERTHELESILSDIHPYYHRKTENTYFIVLTQSCDLVRGRASDGLCKADYISIAPVRPLNYILQEEVDNMSASAFGEIKVCSSRDKKNLSFFLSRLLNNNHPEYFYLHKDPARGLHGDYMAMLRLSVAIKKMHYQTCLDARILQLTSEFQAKLGWLVGEIYSRVGTTDWAPEKLESQVKRNLDGKALWVEDKELARLKKKVRAWQGNNPSNELTPEVLEELSRQTPSKKEEVESRIESIIRDSPPIVTLLENEALTERELRSLINLFRVDPTLATLLK
ncbi:MAG: hypothetical protein ABFS24_00035 [Pseudomonadota bacterium]